MWAAFLSHPFGEPQPVVSKDPPFSSLQPSKYGGNSMNVNPAASVKFGDQLNITVPLPSFFAASHSLLVISNWFIVFPFVDLTSIKISFPVLS